MGAGRKNIGSSAKSATMAGYIPEMRERLALGPATREMFDK